jgi:hypothetical protein
VGCGQCKEFTCATHGNGACATTQHSPWPLRLACTRLACPSSDAMRSSPKHPYLTTFRHTLALYSTAGPCTATTRPYTPLAHPRISHLPDSCPSHWDSLLEIPSLIPSSPACIPSLRHTCITVAPHQQHYATHTIPQDLTFPCRSDEQVPPPVCIPPPGYDRVASPTVRRRFSVRSLAS